MDVGLQGHHGFERNKRSKGWSRIRTVKHDPGSNESGGVCRKSRECRTVGHVKILAAYSQLLGSGHGFLKCFPLVLSKVLFFVRHGEMGKDTFCLNSRESCHLSQKIGPEVEWHPQSAHSCIHLEMNFHLPFSSLRLPGKNSQRILSEDNRGKTEAKNLIYLASENPSQDENGGFHPPSSQLDSFFRNGYTQVFHPQFLQSKRNGN